MAVGIMMRLVKFTCTYSLLSSSTKITWKLPKLHPSLHTFPKLICCFKNNNIVCLNILTLWYVQTGPVEVVGSLPKSHPAHPGPAASKVSQVTSVAATVSVPGQLLNSSYYEVLMAKHSSAYHSQNRQKSNYSNSPLENSPRKGPNTSVAEALGKVEADEKAEE